MLASAARVLGAVTARWPRTWWRSFADGLGVALPAGTPRRSNDGCVGQGGAAGFSPETIDGGGTEKTTRRGGRALVTGRTLMSPAARGGDGRGEARSKRGGRWGRGRAH
jgi:hypothetical protein